MTTTITELRRHLFDLAEKALGGEPVEFSYKGQVLRMTPKKKISKLSRLTPMPVVNPDLSDFDQATRDLYREMEKEWSADWDEL
ncbi:MAG: hypothetical protein ACR2I2_23835 [Bryobacteraceae bacterium]